MCTETLVLPLPHITHIKVGLFFLAFVLLGSSPFRSLSLSFRLCCCCYLLLSTQKWLGKSAAWDAHTHIHRRSVKGKQTPHIRLYIIHILSFLMLFWRSHSLLCVMIIILISTTTKVIIMIIIIIYIYNIYISTLSIGTYEFRKFMLAHNG